MTTNNTFENAYHEAVRREKLAVRELQKMRHRAEVAERQNVVLAAELKSWQEKICNNIESINKMKKVINYTLKFLVVLIFAPILIIDIIAIVLTILVWTILIHKDYSEEDLILDRMGNILQLPAVWQAMIFYYIDRITGQKS